jgi:hypothetical protein
MYHAILYHLVYKTTKDQCESCRIISDDVFETDDDKPGILNRITKGIKHGVAVGPTDTEQYVQATVLSPFSHLGQLLLCSCAVRDNTAPHVNAKVPNHAQTLKFQYTMSFYSNVMCKGTASRRWVGRGDVACREETDSSRSRCRTGINICCPHTYGFRSNAHMYHINSQFILI